MPYDINTSLENLEKGLKDIQSAKEQVEKTVKTSEELQSVVSKYVTSLESLHTNVMDWVKEISSFQSSNIKGIEDTIIKISTSCDKVISTFSASTDKLSSNLKNIIEKELGNFEGVNSLLSSQVDKLIGLDKHLKSSIDAVAIVKEKIVELHKELKDSQRSQDESLNTLKNAQNGISAKTDDIVESCKSILKAQNSVLDDLRENKDLLTAIKENVLDEISICLDKISDVEKSVLDIKRENESYSKQIKSEISITDQKVQSLTTQLSATTQDLKKDIKINRWIMIAGIVILIVLLFVCK